jgi:eukaryotic-like serine/threonine-protein kinase
MTREFERLEAALSERYRLRHEIGRGGMATVYLADDLKHERRVAVKVLRPELATAVGPERFLREIGVTARLDHPHIVPLLDSGEADAHLYYVMPYVEGESLRDRLRRETQLPLEEALRITAEAADALSYAHGLGVVHRDVKPENILLSAGHARVVDFGIARAVTVAAGEGLTRTGMSVGTPIYMSPEQASGEEVDARSDVYALGAVAYEMLAGEPPYTGPTSASLLAKKLVEPVPSVRTVREAVPAGVDTALRRALARLPADRFGSCSEFAEALHRSDFATDAGATLPRRRLAYVGLGALALLAGLLLVQPWQGARGGGPSSAGVPGGASALTPDRIAVFPFQVQAGPELDYLGEALMDLVSEAVDGLGELRRVDPFALMSRVRAARSSEEPRRAVLVPTAREIAAHFGAGRFVLGSVTDLGADLRIAATLYEFGDPPTAVATASARGDPTQLPALVEELASTLVADVPLGGGARLEQIATVRAESYEAFQAYLEGEGLLRRGEFGRAGLKFEEAVAADSTFALAWYRLGVAQGGWGARGDGATSMKRALDFSENLTPRDRRTVEAYVAFLSGEIDRAEELAGSAVGSYPDHLEAWFVLAAVQLFYRWKTTVPLEEFRQIVDRMLALDPDYPQAVSYAIGVAGNQRRYGDARALLPRAPDMWVTFLDRISLVFAIGDTAEQRAAMQRAEDRPVGDHALAGLSLAGGTTDSLEAAGRLWTALTRRTGASRWQRASTLLHLAHLEVARGRWSAAAEAYRLAADSIPHALAHHAILAAQPFYGRPREELEALRSALTDWTGPDTEPLPWDLGTALPEPLLPWVREYALGLVSARLQDSTSAERFARALERAEDPADPAGLRRDLAREIRALLALDAGRPAEALAALGASPGGVTSSDDVFFPLYKRPVGRFLRAEALHRLGREDEAMRWYGTMGHARSWEYVYLAPVYLRQAEILERRGERADALQHYTWFLARWKDADPEYALLIQDVRSRVQRLSAMQP